MTAAKAPAPSTYVSGFCGVRAHERCRGIYAGCACTCACHVAPQALPDPEPLEPLLLARHCPTCACDGHG